MNTYKGIQMKKAVRLITIILISIFMIGDIGGSAAIQVVAAAEAVDKLMLQPMEGSLSVTEKPVTIGSELGTLPTPQREGYVFEGWYTGETNGQKVTESTIADEKLTMLYARWIPLTVTVYLQANGVSLQKDSITVTYGKNYEELPVLKKEGFEFDGWYTDYNEGNKISKGSRVEITSPITLYARWKGKNVVVNFDAAGGAEKPKTIQAAFGQKYGKLPVLTREGYIFDGWYLEEDVSYKITEDTICNQTENHTLSASWIPEDQTVHFDANGGRNISVRKVVEPGECYGDLPFAQRAGHTFLGWFTSSKENATRITSESIVTEPIPKNLYAHWQVNKYEVCLVCNEVGLSENTIQLQYGESYAKLPTPVLENYTFAGWFTQPSGGTRIDKKDRVKLDSDVTLYAQWTAAESSKSGGNQGQAVEDKEKAKLILYANGGIIRMDEAGYDSYEILFDAKETVGSLPVPEREGYEFKGWYATTEGGTSVTNGTAATEKLYARWSGKPCTVILDYDGGTGGVTSVEVVCGGTYGTLLQAVKENHIFDGWYTAQIGGEKIKADTQIIMVTDHILYARFHEAEETSAGNADASAKEHEKEKTYVLRFDAMGGTTDTESMTIKEGEVPEALPEASRKGFRFLGWFPSQNSTRPITQETIGKITEDATYIAKWEGEQYTLTFDANGGEVATKTKTIVVGNAYGALPVPRRTGYKFIGWYTEALYGSKVTEGMTVSNAENHSLYAMWKPEVFIVSYHPNKGSVAITDIAVPVGEQYSEFPEAVRAGYTFTGWYTAIAGGKRVNSLSEQDTLYAGWKANQYTVSLDSGEETTELKVTYGEKYGTLPTPVREGATFAGWYTEKQGETRVTKATKVTTAGDHTLYAAWKGVSVEVSFDTAEGKKISGTRVVVFGEPYGELPTPEREGFDFLGWYTVDGKRITEERIVKATQAHTLYARWTEKYAEILFVGNGGMVIGDGKSEAKLSKRYVYKMPYETLPEAVQNGYRFDGWYTAAVGGEKILPEKLCEVKLSDTYYAQWTPIQYERSLDANGGSCDTEKLTVVFGESYGKLPVPVYEGYSFAGWYMEPDGTEPITDKSIVTVPGNRTLYARWEAKGYELVLEGNGGKVTGVNTDGSAMLSDKYTQTVYAGGTLGGDTGSFPLFRRSGYDFLGFFAGIEDTTPITANLPVDSEETQTAYAHWKPMSVKVCFDPNGGDSVGTEKTVFYDSEYGELPVAVRQGYTFEGWTAIRNSSRMVTADTIVSKRTTHTLYAKWKAVEKQTAQEESGTEVTGIEVSFYPNGGSCATESQIVRLNERYGRLPVPKREGYDFIAWTTQLNGGDAVDATTVMDLEENHVLYALWREKTVTVVFYPDGGSLEQRSITVTYGGKYGELPIPVLQNHTFSGWYADAGRKEKIEAKSEVEVTKTQTLYPLWEPLKVVVTLDAGEGTVKPANVMVLYETPYGDLPQPEKEGRVFDGWYTAAEGGECVDSQTIVRSAQSHTLYAHWKKATSILLLDANGGSARIRKRNVLSGNILGVLPNATRSGYEFAGWYTDVQGGTLVTQSSIMPELPEMTIYAQWKHMKYTVTLDAVGGTVEKGEIEVSFDKAYGELPVPTYAGYQFTGWYLDIEGKQPVTAQTVVSTAKNHSLYASYKKQ